VRYALKPAVDIELDRLKGEGVISKNSIRDWTTPIVVEPKKKKTIKLGFV